MRIIYPDTGRKLKQLITGLLKSGLTQEVRRMNYVQSYTIQNGKITKQPEKIIRIDIKDGDTKKLENFLAKNCKEAKIWQGM